MADRRPPRSRGHALRLYLLFVGVVLLLSTVDLLRSRHSALERGFGRSEAAVQLLAKRMKREAAHADAPPCSAHAEPGACPAWVRAVQLPEGISLAVFDSDLTLLGRVPEAPVGEPMRSNPVLSRVVADGTSGDRFRRISVYDGTPRLFAIQRVEGSGLFLVAGIDEAEVLFGWRRYAVLHLLIVLGLMLLATLLFWRHVRLEELQRALQADRDAASRLRASREAEVERREAGQTRLRRIIHNAELLAAVSAQLLEAEGEHTTRLLRRALHLFREHFGADRSALLLTDADHERFLEVIEVTAKGVEPNGDQIPETIGDGFPLLRILALQQPHVYIRDIRDLQALLGKEAQLVDALGISSLLLCPLLIGDRIVGFLTLDCVQRHIDLDLEALALCRVIGDSFANALALLQEEERLRDSEARFRAIAENAENLPIQSYDQEGRVLFWNRGSELLYGYRADEVLGRPASELLGDAASQETMQNYLESLDEPLSAGGDLPQVELAVRHAQGHLVHVVTRNVAFVPQIGRAEFYAVDVDVTALRRMEAQLREQATRDELTGVASRRAFLQRLEREVALMQRHGWPLALLMVDADRFKAVNDRWGHAAGDAVLRTLGAVLRDTVRETDLIGRIGGEEFAVALPQTGPEAALVVASRIRAGVAHSETIVDGTVLHFTVSVGVGVVEKSERVADALLSQADTALYAAKRAGRDRVVLWTDSMPAIEESSEADDSFDAPLDVDEVDPPPEQA